MRTRGLHNEKELLARIASGDESALASLMDHYTPVVYPYLLYWIKNVHLVQEVTQDIFIRLWRNRHKLPVIENFSGYIYVVARNAANSAIHAELLGEHNELTETFQQYFQQASSKLEAEELAAILDEAINTLPPKRQAIFKLSRIEEMTYEQIGERLGISRNTVKGHIVEALVYLRDYLKKHADIILLGIAWVGAYLADLLKK